MRCSVCSYVFRVAPKRGGTPTWQIRTIDEMQFFAPDLKTLRAWIAEGRLHPDDQVSRTGKHWLRLGDMPEFSTAFAGFRGLPDVFVPVESPALDELGPPPSFAGDGATMGVPELTQPPQPTGVIHLETPGEATVRKRIAGRSLPSAMATEPVLEGRRPPPPAPLPSQVPTAQASVSGEMRDPHVPPPSIPGLGGVPESVAAPRAEPKRPSRAISVAVTEDVSGVVIGPRPTVESSGQRRAASMLEAVTSIVQPVVRPAEERARPPSTPVVAEPEPPSMGAVGPASSAATTAGVPPSLHAPPPAEIERVDRKRRRGWPLVAGLGALAGVAVVFGIPSVRDRVLGVAGGIVGAPAESPGDPAGADAALASLDPSALAAAEGALRERGDAASRARAAEIVATRALLAAIEAAIAGSPPPAPPADLETAGADARSHARASVLVVLARGGLADATAADRETQLIAAAAPLWRDPNAGVPTGVIGGLERIERRSGLASVVLALAYWRGGDERRAREIAAEQLQRAPGQPTAEALSAALTPAVADDPTAARVVGETGGDAQADVGASDTGEVIALADDDGEGDGAAVTGPPATSAATDDEPRLSVDGLISRGCSKVESGDASGGVKLLEKAHDRRPADVDAMLCLGQAYAKLGSHGTALRYFESTLERSPKFVAAVRGAAKSAARLGKTKKAVGYYERLLELDPGNADAKAYVAEHGGASEPPSPGHDDGESPPVPPSEVPPPEVPPSEVPPSEGSEP